MMLFVFKVWTRYKQEIEIAATVNALNEIVLLQLTDGSNAWNYLEDLVRSGHIERFGSRGGEDVYRIHKEALPVKKRHI